MNIEILNNGQSVKIDGKQYSITSSVVKRLINNPLNADERAKGEKIKQLLLQQSATSNNASNSRNSLPSSSSASTSGNDYASVLGNASRVDWDEWQINEDGTFDDPPVIKINGKRWKTFDDAHDFYNFMLELKKVLPNDSIVKSDLRTLKSLGADKPLAISQSNQPSTPSTLTASNVSVQAKALIDEALKGNKNLTNLSSQSWWNSKPQDVRTQAYAELQSILGSPQSLAKYVKDNGLTNLQSYSWWSSSPYKTEAWGIIEQPSGQESVNQPNQPANNASSNTPATTAPTGEREVQILNDGTSVMIGDKQYSIDSPVVQRYLNSPLNADERALGNRIRDLINNSPTVAASATTRQDQINDFLRAELQAGRITQGEYDLFSETVKGWDTSKEINIQNVLDEFKNIKTKTIDPYYREQVDVYIRDAQAAAQRLERQRATELEQERFVSGENIRQAKEGLQKAGMTFSGKAIEQLGAESAFSQDGSSIPAQTPFGGLFYEGKVPMANRVMSSSSSERYKNSLQDLARSTETYLGESGLSKLGLNTGYAPRGISEGSFEQSQQRDYANTLSQLAGQNRQNINYNTPIQYNF